MHNVLSLLPQRLALLLALCATSACAHTPLPVAAKEPNPMTDPTAAPAGNPHLSVEEVGKRFLRLLDSIHTRDDITKERVEEVMGLRLSLSVDGTFYGAEQNEKDGWIWTVNFYPEGDLNKNGVGLRFINEDRLANMTPVCSLNFDYYDKFLKGIGFISSVNVGEMGEIINLYYNRGEIDLTLTPQNRTPGKESDLCVQSLATLNW